MRNCFKANEFHLHISGERMRAKALKYCVVGEPAKGVFSPH